MRPFDSATAREDRHGRQHALALLVSRETPCSDHPSALDAGRWRPGAAEASASLQTARRGRARGSAVSEYRPVDTRGPLFVDASGYSTTLLPTSRSSPATTGDLGIRPRDATCLRMQDRHGTRAGVTAQERPKQRRSGASGVNRWMAYQGLVEAGQISVGLGSKGKERRLRHTWNDIDVDKPGRTFPVQNEIGA